MNEGHQLDQGLLLANMYVCSSLWLDSNNMRQIYNFFVVKKQLVPAFMPLQELPSSYYQLT